MWPGPPRPSPGRTITPASPSPRTTSASSRSPRSIQEKFACEGGEEVDGRVGVVVELELDVGLVEDDRDVAGQPLAERPDLRRREVGAGRVVRVADEDELGRRGDLGGHRVEVVDVPVAERDADL